MFGDSELAVALAWAVLGALCILAWLRLRSIWGRHRSRRRKRDGPRSKRGAPRFKDLFQLVDRRPNDVSGASLNAAVFGVAASLSLGVVTPLELVDNVVGGNNNWNLFTSCLTVAAFWFFRNAVRGFTSPNAPRYRKRLLLALLACIAVPFFLIDDRGTTSAQFMAEHADQIPSVLYNIIYMCVLGWIVGDMVVSLRHQWKGRYATFLIGLTVVLLSCVDEIAYVLLAYFAPGRAADVTYFAFYVLCFGGILIVASGWTWVVILEQDYLGRLQWRARSAALLGVLVRVRRAAATNERDDRSSTRSIPIPARQPSSSVAGPNLLVAEYRSPDRTTSTLSVVPTETIRDFVRALMSSSSEEAAYRLVVQVRNTAVRHGVTLSPAEEERLVRVEQLFPGY